jgi:hypothetical protein
MLADGLIEAAGERPDPALDDERRHYHRLTARGRQALQAELQRYAHVTTLAEQRRLLPDMSLELP